MTCSKCGSKLEPKALFCPKCGAWIKPQAINNISNINPLPTKQPVKKSRNERLKEWKQLAKTQYQNEDDIVRGGRDAEVWLHSIVKSHLNYRDAHSFAGRRVQAPDGRKEIDLIIATKQMLHTIEVKNWSGELCTYAGKWIQCKTNGERIEFPNIVTQNDQKQSYLLEYLRKKEVGISRNKLSQKVILMNPKLRIDQAIYNNPNVITRDKLDSYLNRQKRAGFAEKIIYSVIDYCLSQEEATVVVDGLFGSMTKNTFSRLITALAELRTWDKVYLYGTKILTGDLRRINIAAGSYDINNLKQGSEIRVRWTRNKIIGLSQAYFNWGNLGKIVFSTGEVLPLSSEDYIYFHRAGQPKPEQIRLTDVELIQVG